MPYHQVLELCALPQNPDVYLLGVHARRVTFYSQQCRAINLVDALEFHSGRGPLRGKRVAIVGAGAAGVTAAARLLKYEAEVTVFEKAPGAVSIQGNSRHRYLHPSIYDWPFSAMDPAERDAKLPVMNWSAGMAAEVAASLDGQFRNLKAVEFVPSTAVTAIRQQSPGVQIEWAIGARVFDLAIIAVGFGLEPEGLKQNSYWEGDPVDYTARDNPSILILGYGDGALTDLMRACVLKFDHEKFLQDIIGLVPRDVLDRIRGIESHPFAEDAGFLTAHYALDGLVVPEIRAFLADKINRDRKVFLAGPGANFFDPRACAINRFVASHLLAMKAFMADWFSSGERIAASNPNDQVLAELQRDIAGKAGEPAKRVLFRFGPEPAMDNIQGIAGASATLKETWSRVKVAEDLTRQRLWETPFATYSSGRLRKSCVIVGQGGLNNLTHIARNVLQRREKDFGLSVEPVQMEAGSCLATREALLSAARAMCASPLVIFELGEGMGKSNLAGMILLGIRAAVRRGLTLAVTGRDLDTKDWDAVPFNLKEIQILALPFSRIEESRALLTNSIAAGLKTLSVDAAAYRDLPVFDIVRRAERRTPALQSQVEALVLCSFSPHHADNLWPVLKNALEGDQRIAEGKLYLRRILEYSSPLLVAERLYELIRFAGICVVDWTDWKPNVFFELGVRLAVHRDPPLIIATVDALADGGAPERKDLAALFRPVAYSEAAGDVDRFQGAFEIELRRRREGTGAPLDSVYEIARRHVLPDQEFGALPVDVRLLQAVRAAVGPDITLTGRPAVLYEDPRLEKQALDAAIDTVWAAFLLVRDRLDDPALAPETCEKTAGSVSKLGSTLRDLLELCDDGDHLWIRQRLGKMMKEVRKC